MKRIRPLMVLLVSLALACMGSTLAFADSESSARAAQSEAVADGNTASTWRDWGLENSTENVGRIWTDKTVQAGDITLTGAGGEKNIAKGDSTFLTALSAISSTSNVTSRTDVPLDIVLVLDASGSMNDAMGRDDSTRRIIALQKAANSFIDEIAKQNSSVSDEAKQHQVSIVKFAGDKTDEVGNDEYKQGQYWYNNSQVMKEMAKCTDGTKDQFKNTINDIKPSGATHADYGFELAQGQSSNRSDAKKIVIFFTDGTPTSYSNFDPSVASAAVSAAKNMKDAGASVYTIGIFSGADPTAEVNSATDENKFMQAASSNYPDATYSSDWGRYSWNFGNRADKSDYYKSATNSDDLKKVFDDISKEIVQGAGCPTDTKEGYEDESGWITFTDQLGDYMQVDGFTTIVFANQVFENPVKTTNGLVDTYVFSGKAGSALYPEGDLSDIDITVTHSADLKTGDKVEVKIPAGLIPLRHFQVNADGTGSVDLTFPIRAFYGSSLKAGVAEAMANPDVDLAAYIESNSADGKVSFLANKWNGGSDGDTVANFTPSKGNSYYYITEDTPIFADEACTQRATAPLQQGKTYYYQRAWYDLEGGSAVQKTRTVSFNSGVVESINGYIASDANSKAYFKAGTPRMTYINELKTAKGEASNQTKTAGTFINPKWAGDQVNVLLGNNGKLSVSQPGTLAVSKTVEVPDGYNVADFADESFEFTVSVPDAKSTTLKAQVKNVEGENVGSEFDVAFDENVEAKHSLKHGETLYLYGLSSGSAYTVTETPKAGFTQTSPADEASATGAIEAGKTSNADFVNRYNAEISYTAAGGLNVAKTLNGRDMTNGQFEIKVTPADEASADALNLPTGGKIISMPASADGVQVAKQVLDGDVVFRQNDVGKTYTYKVAEQGAAPNGYTYDTAERTVAITVADNPSAAKLVVTTTVSGGPEGTKTFTYGSDEAAVATVPFVNSYKAEGGLTEGIAGTKALSGRNLAEGEFTFAVKYAAGGDDLLTAQNAADGSIAFGKLSYSTELLAQLVKDGKATKNSDGSWTVRYAAYEKTDGLAAVGVTAQTQPIAFTVTVVDNGDGTLAATPNLGDGLKFENAYNADAVSVGLSGVKMLEAEQGLKPADITGKFTFTVTGEDGAPMPERTLAKNDAAGKVDFGTITFTLDSLNKALEQSKPVTQSAEKPAANAAKNNSAAVATDGASAQVAAASNGAAGAAAQNGGSTAKASEPAAQAGTPRSHVFTYKIIESGSAPGVTNDPDATKTVRFKVTDDGNGKLTVARVDPADASKPAFAFTNTYSVEPVSSSVTDQIAVTKQLTGRDLAAGEFSFELIEAGNVVATGSNDAEGNVVLGAISYSKPGTHNYTLREVDAGTQQAGVTYDGTVYNVTTTVTDNGDGVLSVAHKLDGGVAAATFSNVYSPAPTSATLGAAKILKGKSLEADEFTFVLTGEDGSKMTAKNDANGNVAFGELKFVEQGTYHYTVAEEKGSEAGVTYDETTYPVTVVVEDDGQGNLTAAVSYEQGAAPVFTNTYQKPEGPLSFITGGDSDSSSGSAVVKTGDATLALAAVLAAVAGLAIAIAALAGGKGRNRKK